MSLHKSCPPASKRTFGDELSSNVPKSTKTAGIEAFWEFLKIEIDALNNMGERLLYLSVGRGQFCPIGKGSILIPQNLVTLPDDARAFLDAIAPFVEKDDLTVVYEAPDEDGDGEGVIIRW